MILKRCFDIVASITILLLTLPVWMVVSTAIWLESGRPILFRQQRVGLSFKRFDILKFRTMRVHAGGPTVTVGGDPRVTLVGRLLRATKIDELPQFYNVLRGDMSVVGPRPEVVEYVEMFRSRYRAILSVRPGITDPASLRFRNEETILAASSDPLNTYKSRILPAKLELAEQYIRHRSLCRDVGIIFQTAVAMLRRSSSVSSQ